MLSTRVVKLGGNELHRPAWLAACARALVRLDPVVVVHGGGRAVSALSRRLGLPVEKRDGRRVTTPEVAEVVELVMGGPVNRQVVDVGDIAEVRVALLESFLLAGLTPVIAPMAPEASGAEGPPLNVNADDAAAAIAGALRAAELLLVSDVSGVEVDGAVRPTLEVGDVETLIELGVAADGMAAKLRAATAALRAGARAVRIGDVHLLDDARAGTRILAPAVQPA